MNIISVVGFCVVAAFLAIILRKFLPEYAMVITLLAGAIIMLFLMSYFGEIIKRINNLLSQTGMSQEYTSILFKGIGICIITQLASDSCRDAGESALAEKAQFAGKVMLLVLALPLFEKVVELAISFMSTDL